MRSRCHKADIKVDVQLTWRWIGCRKHWWRYITNDAKLCGSVVTLNNVVSAVESGAHFPSTDLNLSNVISTNMLRLNDFLWSCTICHKTSLYKVNIIIKLLFVRPLSEHWSPKITRCTYFTLKNQRLKVELLSFTFFFSNLFAIWRSINTPLNSIEQRLHPKQLLKRLDEWQRLH